MTVQRTSEQAEQSALHVLFRKWRLALAVLALPTLLALVLWYIQDSSNESVPDRSVESLEEDATSSGHPSPSPDSRWLASEYVGSQRCSECHSDIAETYAAHPMAQTLATVADASAIETVEGDASEFEALGCRYRVDRLNDRMIHTEFMTDATGNLVYEQSVDVHYSVGSGVTARTYLIDRGGIMFESPITWYTDKQKWDLSPGYHANPRQRFNRRVVDGCVQCHAGRVAPTGDGNSNRFEEQPFAEHGIGCERCHGPGKQHVARFTADDWDTEDEAADSMLIVNPARLDQRLRDSVCYQCHMEGETRILRKNKSFHDFRPGMATEDIWTVFVSQQPFESAAAIPFTSQVEQMHASACFRGSDGRMSCTSCHDPHRAPRREEQAAFYRERCNSCHLDHGCSLSVEERESPPANNSCIHCHMPAAGPSDVLHVSQSDHRVLRQPGSELKVVEQPIQDLVWTIFDDSDSRMPDWEVQRARALALSDQALEEKNRVFISEAVRALEAVVARDPEDMEALQKLGFLYGSSGDPARAGKLFAKALQVNPHDEMSLKNSGLMASRTNSIGTGLRSYKGYLEINKWDGTMFGPFAALLANSGDLPAALNAVERGLQLDPTQRELRGLAVQLYERTGNRKVSQQHRAILQEIKKQLDPWDQKRLERIRREMQNSQPQN
jgi:hypothetical protein